eukprot:g6846.t1
MSSGEGGNSSDSSHYNKFFPDGVPNAGAGNNNAGAGGQYPRGDEPDWHFRGGSGSMHGTPSLYGRREYTNEVREAPTPATGDRFPTLTAELHEQERQNRERQLPPPGKVHPEGESKRLRDEAGDIADRGVSDSLSASLRPPSAPGPASASIAQIEEAIRGIVMSQRTMLEAAVNLEGNIQSDNAAVQRAMVDFRNRIVGDQQILDEIAKATGQQQGDAIEMRDRVLSNEHAVGGALRSLAGAAVKREVEARRMRDQMNVRDEQIQQMQSSLQQQNDRASAQDEKINQVLGMMQEMMKSRSRSRSASVSLIGDGGLGQQQAMFTAAGQQFMQPPPPKHPSKGAWDPRFQNGQKGVEPGAAWEHLAAQQWPQIDPYFQGKGQVRQVPPVPYGTAIPGHPSAYGAAVPGHPGSSSTGIGTGFPGAAEPQSYGTAEGASFPGSGATFAEQFSQQQQMLVTMDKQQKKGAFKGGKKGPATPVPPQPFDNMPTSPDGAWVQTPTGEWKMRPTPGVIRADDLVHVQVGFDEPELALTSSGLMGTLPSFSFKLESEMIIAGEGPITDDRKRARISTKDVVALLKPFNTKESLIKHHTKVSGAIKACMSGGPVLSFDSENAIVQMGVLEHCHAGDEKGRILRFGLIREGRDQSSTLRAYFVTLMQMFPELSTEAHDKIVAWSVSGGGWLKKGANLLGELVRIETCAFDIGFNLHPTGYVQQLYVLYEIGLRILVPAGIQRQIQLLWSIPVCTFWHVKEFAKNDRNATTALAVAEIRDSQAAFARQVGDVMPVTGQGPDAGLGGDGMRIDVCEPVGEEVMPDNALVAAPVRPAYPKHGKGGQRRNSQTSVSSVQKYPCANCNSMEHFTRNCPKPRQCRICGAQDHISTSCPENKANARKILFAKFVRQTRDRKFNGKRPSVTVRSLLDNGETVDEVELFSSDDLEKLFSEMPADSDASAGEIDDYIEDLEQCELSAAEEEEILEAVRSVRVLQVEVKAPAANSGADAVELRFQVLFDHDSGFTAWAFCGLVWVNAYAGFLQQQQIPIARRRVDLKATTAGGQCRICEVTVVPFFSRTVKQAGLCKMIVVDDRHWPTGQEAPRLVGVQMQCRHQIHTTPAGPGDLAVKWGSWIGKRVEDRFPIPLFDGVTDPEGLALLKQMASKVQGAITMDDEEKFFLPGVSEESIPLARALMRKSDDAEDEKADKEFWRTSLEAPTEKEELNFVHRKIYIGTSTLQPADERDVKACRRVVRNLDDVQQVIAVDRNFNEGGQLKTGRSVKEEQKLVLKRFYEHNQLNNGHSCSIIVDYFFEQQVEGSAKVETTPATKIPIVTRKIVSQAAVTRLMFQLRPPADQFKLRVITIHRGYALPPRFNNSSTVLIELDGTADDAIAKVEEEIGRRVAGFHPAAMNAIRNLPTVKHALSRAETAIADKAKRVAFAGDGVKSAVTVGELFQEQLGLVGAKRVQHQQLTRMLYQQGERADITGALRPWGVTNVTELQLECDRHSVQVASDPREGMSDRELRVYGHMFRLSVAMGWMIDKNDLATAARKSFKNMTEPEIRKAVEAAVMSGLTALRLHSRPGPKTTGTWAAVDPRAITQMDTTFLGPPTFDQSEAFLAAIRLFEEDSFGEYLGKKEKVKGDADGRGHPNREDIMRFMGMLLQFGVLTTMLLTDPDPAAVVLEVIRFALAARRRVRVTTKNTPRAQAKMERRHLTWKMLMHRFQSDPQLKVVPLTMLCSLAHAVISERMRIKNGTYQRFQSYPISPEGDYLVEWSEKSFENRIAISAEQMERGREHISQLVQSPELWSAIEKLKNEILQGRHHKFRIHQPVKYVNKAKEWHTGTYAGTQPSGAPIVKPFGKQSGVLDLGKGNVVPFVDTEYSIAMPESLEVFSFDLPHLESVLQQARDKGKVERIVGKFVYRICVDCGEDRALAPSAVQGEFCRCATLKNVICGDESDSKIYELDGWIYPRLLKDEFKDKPPSKFLLPKQQPFEEDEVVDLGPDRRQVEFKTDPEVQEFDPAVPVPAPEEDSDDATANSAVPLPDEEVASTSVPESEDEDDISVVDLAVEEFYDAATIAACNLSHLDFDKEELSAGDTEFLTSEEREIRDIEIRSAALTANDVAERANRPTRKPKYEDYTLWTASVKENYIGVLDKPSEFARLLLRQFKGSSAVLVTDPVWWNFVEQTDSVRRWYLDDVSMSWGKHVARLNLNKSPHEGRTCFGLFVVAPGGDEEKAMMALPTKTIGPDVMGAVRFEFNALQAVDEESSVDRMIRWCRPGFTAGMRKTIRAGNKLADLDEDHLMEGMDVDDWVMEAEAFELEGLVTAKTERGNTCVNVCVGHDLTVIEARLTKNGKKKLTSRFLKDGKKYSLVFVILKSRRAPGGHIQRAVEGRFMESSENASPTLSGLELRLLLASANFLPKPIEVIILDLPRAFNQSDEYPEEERPVCRIPPPPNRRARRALERAFAKVSKKIGKTLTWETVYEMVVPQYGVLEAAMRFYLTVVRRFAKQKLPLSGTSRTIYRLFDKEGLKALAGEHVDDFLMLVCKLFVVELMTRIKAVFKMDSYIVVNDKWETFCGKQFRHFPERKEIHVSCIDKVKELKEFRTVDEQAGRQLADPDRFLTADEISELRSTRGGAGWVVEQLRLGQLYQHKTCSWGSDECRTAGFAKRLQNRPFVVKSEDGKVKNKGRAVVIDNQSPQFEQLTEENMLPLNAHILLLASYQEILDAAKTKADVRVVTLSWHLETGKNPVGSSLGGETESHQSGVHRSEIVKTKWAGILNPPQEFDPENVLGTGPGSLYDVEGLRQFDLIDNGGLIQRLLSRTPLAEASVWLYQSLLKSRCLMRQFPRKLVHTSDQLMMTDVLTKHTPTVNAKMQLFKRMMGGFLKWYSPTDKRSSGGLGVIRENITEAEDQPVEDEEVLLPR